MSNGRILKDSNTSLVSRITWNDKDIVVKRYNHKGLVHSLRHTIKQSRAKRGWLHAHRLGMLNVATPKPLAFIEQRSPIVWKSYLVTEYVEGQNLYFLLRDNAPGKEQLSKLMQQVTKLLDKLAEHRITHGDMKHSNIVITDNGPVLTDLDAMKVYRWNWLFKLRRRKDITRLTKKYPASQVKDENKS